MVGPKLIRGGDQAHSSHWPIDPTDCSAAGDLHARNPPYGTAPGAHNSTFAVNSPADPATRSTYCTGADPPPVTSMHLANLALVFHVLIEAPASLSFLLNAPKQLRESRPSPEAVLVCQSYGGLLISTNVLCLLLLCSRGIATFDDASAIVAASLAMYHVMPMRRAWARIKAQGAGRGWLQQADALGGPYVHFLVHALLLVSLASAGFLGIVRGKP